jgi:putative ABC transport system permease protein
MPAFSRLIDRPLDQTPGFDGVFWGMSLGLWVAGIVAACFWPSLALSGFSPLSVMRSDFFKKRSPVSLRHALVVFQFACSTILILVVLTVVRQLHFLQNHDKGLSLDQVVTMRMPNTNWRQDSLNRPKLALLQEQIAQVPGVQSVAASSIVPAMGISSIEGTSTGLYWIRNQSASANATTYFLNIGKGFLETYNIRMAAGQYYSAANEGAENDNILINEAARKMLGFPSAEAAIGEEIAFRNNTHPLKIHGVIADFHIESLKEPTRPTLYYCQRQVRNGYLSLKIKASDATAVMAQVQPIWQRIWPESPLEWKFLDAHFNAQYRLEQQLGRVFGLFSGLAILIACLGLLGLAAYTAERRVKEIGIRKVLGASVTHVTGLLAGDFLRLVVIAVVIASPIAWYFMQQWLSSFALHIELSWWMFVVAGICALLIATLTIGIQSIRAALANPVKSLRNE